MDYIVNGVAGFLRTMSFALGSWSFTRNISADMAIVTPYLEKANMFIPIATVLVVLGIWISLQLVLLAYYWITRAINLIRGAG